MRAMLKRKALRYLSCSSCVVGFPSRAFWKIASTSASVQSAQAKKGMPSSLTVVPVVSLK